MLTFNKVPTCFFRSFIFDISMYLSFYGISYLIFVYLITIIGQVSQNF